MKAKKYLFLAALLGICASVIWAVDKTESQTTPQTTFNVVDGRDTLKGLQGVGVCVEYLPPEVEKYGLTKQQLQTDVELRLRQNGIRVFSAQELVLTSGMPFLYVNIHIVATGDFGLAAYSISLKLMQNVFLARDRTKSCLASTWDRNWTGSVGVNKIETLRESVKDSVDMFINDYLAANPKDEQKQ
jgi:hypothetical protein